MERIAMISEDKLKDSALDDNASIYAPRDEKSEKEKFKEMNFQEKVSYYKSYYLSKTIIGLIILGFAAYFVYTIVSPKPVTVLNAAILNYPFSDEAIDKMTSDMENRLIGDNDMEEVFIDASYYLGSGNDVSEYTMGAQQKLTTYIAAGDIDVIIAPESAFQSYTTAGFFSKLTDLLPTEMITALSDSVFESSTSDNPVSGAYGIYLDKAELFKGASSAADRPVFGIVVNSKNQDNSVDYLKYLLDYKE